MTTLREAAQQALWALQYHVEMTWPIDRTSEAIFNLRAALAQQEEPKGGGRLPPPLQAEPVQEPDHTYKLIGCVQHDCEECQRRTQRKPLTGTRVADAIRARGSA
jgi:hypothetical protein